MLVPVVPSGNDYLLCTPAPGKVSKICHSRMSYPVNRFHGVIPTQSQGAVPPGPNIFDMMQPLDVWQDYL